MPFSRENKKKKKCIILLYNNREIDKNAVLTVLFVGSGEIMARATPGGEDI